MPILWKWPLKKKIMVDENNQQYFASFFNFWTKISGVESEILSSGGTNSISGVQLPMATACSEETGEEGEM